MCGVVWQTVICQTLDIIALLVFISSPRKEVVETKLLEITVMDGQRDICHGCAHFFYRRVIYQDSRVILPLFGHLCHCHLFHYHISRNWLNSAIHAELKGLFSRLNNDWSPPHCFHIRDPTRLHAVNHPNWISLQIKGVQCPTAFYRGGLPELHSIDDCTDFCID